MTSVAGFVERRDVCSTDTQYVVQLSGYAWALRQVAGEGLAVLDVASGAGFGTNMLRDHARLVVGVDLAHEPLERAKRRYERTALAFVRADAAVLPFRGGRFDLVVSQDTVEHVADDLGFVAEVRRVLTPGGTFIVFTPWRGQHTATPENPFHLREYSAESLRALLAPHFSEIALWGRRAGQALQQAEAEMDRVRRFDPLRVRAIVPRAVRHRLANAWLWLHGARRLDEMRARDVEYVEGAPVGSTTLIAVCRAGA